MTLDREIARLVEAIATSGHDLPPLLDALKARQARVPRSPLEITRVAAVDAWRIDRPTIDRKVEDWVANWRTRLLAATGAADVSDKRHLLRELLDGLMLLTPDAGRYRFTGSAGIGQLIGRAVYQRIWRARQDLNLRPSA